MKWQDWEEQQALFLHRAGFAPALIAQALETKTEIEVCYKLTEMYRAHIEQFPPVKSPFKCEEAKPPRVIPKKATKKRISWENVMKKSWRVK